MELVKKGITAKDIVTKKSFENAIMVHAAISGSTNATENHKVSLGYKKSEDNPWEQLKNNYPIGSTFHAPVVSLTKFGAFVRILPGVDGLVHISEISNDRVEKVSDALKVGDMVDVKLLDVDFDKKRISLSMKALLNDDAE